MKRSNLCALLCTLYATSALAHESGPAAIMGGQGNAPYAAFIEHDGSVRTLEGLPPTGLTFRVAMNASGEGLIGGTSGVNAYAAFVSPSGLLTPIQGLIAPGEIYTVSINQSGKGIVGGGVAASSIPYAAFVDSSGTALSLTGLPPSGLIYGVAIDETGQGIIGGKGPLNSAYAALASPDGTTTPLVGLPATGAIFWVANNQSGTKFIGGQENTSAYAAFVSPNGTLTPVSGLPQGLLYSVAINDNGDGIIGGSSLSLPYAALVSSNGTAQTIVGLPGLNGIIYNVALNNSGTGLIAGFSANRPYGSFVSPDGSLTPLIGLPSGPGFLDGIALHSSGVAIIGGKSAGAPFAALVAPNGQLTFLDGLPSQGEINSIAIATLDNLVPKKIGLFDSWANSQFALSHALTQHCIFHRNFNQCGCCDGVEEAYSLWIAPFGNYVHEKGHQIDPGFSNKIAGVLLGLDYNACQDVVIGGGLAYSYNDVHHFKHLGLARINQESAVVYTTIYQPYFCFNAALWGGLYQATNTRNSFNIITSKAKPCGWNITPHFEVSSSMTLCSWEEYIFEPFAMFDWANHWQNHYRERGFSGFNIRLKDHHISMLRSEIGIRLYETFECDWGLLIIEEKASYVNRTPFNNKSATASFIGSISSFDVDICNGSGQNHGLAAIHFEFIPCGLQNIYASLDYQGEFGRSFESQTLTFTVGKDF